MHSGNFERSYQVPPNRHGRQLVIADIHGCAKTFQKLLKKIVLTKKDHLFLLGDYINKGPDSVAVLHLIIELIEEGYQIYPLRGNHEEMLLNSHRKAINSPKWNRNIGFPTLSRAKGLADKNKIIFPEFLPFIKHLPFYYELEEFILVHAGFNIDIASPFTDYDTMLWTKGFKGNRLRTKGKRVIIGHVPVGIQKVYRSVGQKKDLIYLDNGCVYPNKHFMGCLICLDLTNWRLIPQRNVEGVDL